MKLFPREWDEFPTTLTTLRRQMNRLLDYFPMVESEPVFEWCPAVDICETPETIVVTAEMPGLEAKDVEISVVGDQLILRGEKKEEKKVEEKDLFFKELTFGKFERSFTLPEGVKAEHVKANMVNGVLEVTMPAGMALASAKVPIQIGETVKKTVKAA